MPKRELIHGNEAVALGALAAGCRFFAGYPITPSTEIAEIMATELPKLGGVFIQMEDEIASIGAIIGASLAGVKSLTATSGPGFSLMQENLGFAAMTEIPLVLVNVMRGGPSTGLPTLPEQGDVMQARWGTHGDHPVIVLAPASVRECFDLTVEAFNLSERHRAPVIILFDATLGHLREVVELPDQVKAETRPMPRVAPAEYTPYDFKQALTGKTHPLPPYGKGYRYHITGLAHDETGFPTNDPAKIGLMRAALAAKIGKNRHRLEAAETIPAKNAKLGVIAYGSVWRSALLAAALAGGEGIPVALLRPVCLWPSPEQAVAAFAKTVERIIVAEMNEGQYAGEIERIVKGKTPVTRVGRVDGELLTPEEILAAVREAAK